MDLAHQLAQVMLAGRWSEDEVAARLATALGYPRPRKWISNLADRIIAAFGRDRAPPLQYSLTRFLEVDPTVRRLRSRLDWDSLEDRPAFNLLDLPRPMMSPAAAIRTTATLLPDLSTPGELAGWLGTTPSQLDWYADCHGRERQHTDGPLRHYRYRLLAKRSGRKRLLEIPKSRLKRFQRKILDEILTHVPSHPAAHAFLPGRSTLTCAIPHTGQRVVLRIDLREFFPSIPSRRVLALFHTIGYPEQVARLLA
ncbi:MAG: RNA-directed DNA polymerase, partial [Planctomycetia bacterium]|nr:RNA-directed DNA polymerase [Planctomycetia bacterium]